MIIDIIEALIFVLTAAATVAAVLLGVRLNAAEKRRFSLIDKVQRKQGAAFLFIATATILSIILFLTRQTLQQRESSTTIALEKYLAVESVWTDLEREVTEEPLAPSFKARQLAAKLPDRGTPYVRALKAATENRYDDARMILAESDDSNNAYRQFRLRAQIETFAGRFSQALFWYRRALREPEVGLDILGEYALALHRASKYTDARRLIEATLTLQMAVFGPKDERIFLGRLAYSNILQDLGLYKDALSELGSACEDLVNYLGSDPYQEALCRTRRGDLLLELGQYEQSESELDRALEGLSPQGDDAPIKRAEVHRLRGMLYHDWGHYKDAEEEYKRSLELLSGTVGTTHPYVALVLNNMGDLGIDTAQYGKAEKIYRRAFKIQAEGDTSNRQFVVTTQHNMARLVEAQGNLDEAEKAYLQALRISGTIYPDKKHKDIGVILGNIAILYDRLGKIERAEDFHRQAIAMRLETLGEQHPLVANAYNNFGSHLARRGLWESAEEYIQKSILITRAAFGAFHPEVARSLNTLGALYLKWKKEQKAEPVLEEALRIRMGVHGLLHPSTAVSLSNLAKCKAVLGKAKEADELFSKAVKVAEHFATHNGDKSLLPILDSYAEFLETYAPERGAERRRQNAALWQQTNATNNAGERRNRSP